MTNIKTYSELIKLKTFKERFEYLNINGIVGDETFGYDRYLNQIFYNTDEWKSIRRKIIVRDNGCDLAIPEREIYGLILIHHINPITEYDIINRTDFLLNPEYLITTSKLTHNVLHYGSYENLIMDYVERKKNDTCPWRH